jgi:hypothetical protein
MTLRHLVFVNTSTKLGITFSDVQSVAQALQIQLDRDFTPVWGIHATVVAIDQGETIPAKAWPMKILNHSEAGLGVHLDSSHKPFAEIEATSDWPITASHEMVEMLVDPYGHRFVSAPDIDPASDGHAVNYLVEVGDPCEVYSYTINGTAVSDFVTPEYYNESAVSGADLDFLGRLSRPYEVPDGCYLSWIDPQDQRWHQKQTDGSFARSKNEAKPKVNPRDDRDKTFGGDEEAVRHNLSLIRTRYMERLRKKSA